MSAIAFTLLFVALPGAAGWVIFNKSADRDRVERTLLTIVAPTMGIAVWIVCFCVVDIGTNDWSGAKLAPIAAVVRGSPAHYSLYQDPRDGVMTGWIYGPISTLLLLPVTLLPGITPMLLAGSAVNFLSVILPALWLIRKAAGSTEGRWGGLAAILAACLLIVLLISHESLRLAAFQIGADGPALGLAACSCALLIDHRHRTDRLFLSALCISAAIWSKQTMLPFLAVGPVYMMLSGRRQAAWRYVPWLIAAFAVVSLLCVVTFGPMKTMWFHMVTLPASHPWVNQGSSRLAILLGVAGELLLNCFTPLSIIVLILPIWRVVRGSLWACGQAAQWAEDNSWLMPLLCALAGLPGALLGFVKIGGYINNFALVTYFVSVSACMLLARALVTFQASPPGALLRSAACLIICVGVLQLISSPGKFEQLATRLANPSNNAQETAYQYLKAQPDEGYFPWNPLAALLANGRLYHFEWGWVDRMLNDSRPLDQQRAKQLSAHIPPASFIAVPYTATTKFILQVFPNFSQPTTSPRLPGFTLYRAPASNRPGGDAP